MTPLEPEPVPSTSPPTGPAPVPLTPSAAPTRPAWVRAAAVAAGLIAGGAAWLGGEAMLDYFGPTAEAAEQRFEFAELNRQLTIVSGQNGAVAFGLLAGALGLTLGLIGGWVRRSISGGLLAALAGLIVGGGLGTIVSLVVLPIEFRLREQSSTDLFFPLMIHMAVWLPSGVAGGLAFGLGLGDRSRVVRALLGGVLGAVLGTVVFEVVAALAFPLSRTLDPISATAETRLFARLTVALFVAIGAAMAVSPNRRERKPPTTEAASGLS